jgi:hypothetical protein
VQCSCVFEVNGNDDGIWNWTSNGKSGKKAGGCEKNSEGVGFGTGRA